MYIPDIMEIISIESPVPAVLDDSSEYLPSDFQADLVLDYLKHPDLSHDLAVICQERTIPLVASGKKIRVQGAFMLIICCALSRDRRRDAMESFRSAGVRCRN